MAQYNRDQKLFPFNENFLKKILSGKESLGLERRQPLFSGRMRAVHPHPISRALWLGDLLVFTNYKNGGI
jgi:hypothetical protein